MDKSFSEGGELKCDTFSIVTILILNSQYSLAKIMFNKYSTYCISKVRTVYQKYVFELSFQGF